jgi:dolichyl-phosphate-mannose-protein mannosyltransferase
MVRSLAAKAPSQARRASSSPSPSPSPSPQPQIPGNSKPNKSKGSKRKPADYSSEGVEDNDVFLLPVSDYQVMIVVTIVAALVRLFRIYQPTSVVFDEVQ